MATTDVLEESRDSAVLYVGYVVFRLSVLGVTCV